jgi:eukaryotic-like serine/threonine-protein kinase
MSRTDFEHPEDRLADVLAAYDDILAAGEEKPPRELEEAVDPALLPDWNRLTAFLALLERAWPRASALALSAQASGPEEELGAVPSPDASGGRFGRFQILGALGQGGFGIVFLAWDPALRRKIALKVPQPESVVTPEARRRFLLEAHAAAGLDHPNIIPVYETGSVGAVDYIAAAYCPGPTLASWLARQARPAPPRDAATLVATLARAVQHAHERGVLHRDLKPSNILLQRLGSHEPGTEEDRSLADFQPRITDFSLAKLADGQGPDTRSGAPFGSPPYMAPEQAQGRLRAIGPPTDVYGLGCILYELLTREPPFRGKSQLDTLRQVIADDPLPPRRRRPDLPAALDEIVLKCLEKEPARRYPSAQALAEELERFLAGEPTRPRPSGRWENVKRAARRHRAAVVVLVISTLFGGVVLGGASWLKARLDESRQIARQWQDEARRRDLAARRAWYAADVHLAAQLLRDQETDRAVELLLRHRPQPGEDDLREFAWYHLLRQCQTQGLAPPDQRGQTTSIAIHRDARTLSLGFSADNRTVIAKGADGLVSSWDLETGALEDHARLDTSLSTSADRSANLAAARAFESLQHRAPVERRKETPTALALSPDGKTLASGGGGSVKLWDVAAGLELLTLERRAGPVWLLRFSPDGKTLAACAETSGERSVLLLWRAVGDKPGPGNGATSAR